MKGIITSLQRMSIHDGPGIRTVVFMKGCNMHCKWCHNPETWSSRKQLQYIQEKCINCYKCVQVCPNQVISITSSSIAIDYRQCVSCGICVEACCTKALSMVGREVTVNDLWEEIKKDVPYFNSSGGGITISGGEPLLQKDFVKQFLAHCKKNHIHTAIETNLSLGWEVIEELIPLTDLWMCDFKIYESEKHKEWTGIENTVIIKNITQLSEKSVSLLVRTPVIPEINDTEEEIRNICQLLAPFSNTLSYELLGFHTLGFNKYESLGMKNELEGKECLSTQRLEELNNIPTNTTSPLRFEVSK